MHGLMRGRWSLLTAVVRGRRVRRSVREQLQVCTSALLYPLSDPYILIPLSFDMLRANGLGKGINDLLCLARAPSSVIFWITVDGRG